jgi:hypothetical protein
MKRTVAFLTITIIIVSVALMANSRGYAEASVYIV